MSPHFVSKGEANVTEEGDEAEEGMKSMSLNKLRDEALRIATEHGFTETSPVEDWEVVS